MEHPLSSRVVVRERSSYVLIFLSWIRGKLVLLCDNVLNINKLQTTTLAIWGGISNVFSI